MTQEGSVAPRERVKITYRPDTGDAQEERELPLRLLVVGDFTGRSEESTVEERPTVQIDKHNFEEVLASQRISLNLQVPDELGGRPAEHLDVHLEFRSLGDFTPDRIARQLPQLRELLEIREALVALKGPLANDAQFRRALQRMVENESQRVSLLDELAAAGDVIDG